jgi:hypothetical protein
MNVLRKLRSRARDDRGVSMLEFAGFLPVLLLVGLAAIQLGLVGYAANQAGVSAPEGGGDTTTATVTVQVPLLIPFVGEGWQVEKKATMPNDDDDG